MTRTLSHEPDMRRIEAGRLQRLGRAGGVFVIVAGLVLLGAVVSRDFLSSANLLNMLRSVTLLGIVAIGLSFIAYSGHYVDLSIPGIMALSGIVSVAALPLGFFPALLCGIIAGLTVGAVNGFIIGYLRVNPIIWTLAMMSILDGLMRWYFQGKQVYPDKGTSAGALMLGLYGAEIMRIPLIFIVLAALAVLGWFLMARTAYGARLKLVGSAYEPARMTGINVRSVVATAFVISAFTSAIAGILLTSLNKVGAVYVGTGYDFIAITAVVTGGVTLAGGRGSIAAALGGVLIIGLVGNIMTLMGFGTFAQAIARGCVFIIAVGLQAHALRRAGRDDA